MSGRGGRGGRGGGRPLSMNIEALGFGRGDALPTASVQPPPMFPLLEHHPLPLERNEKYNYLIDLKRYFQTSMEDSPYYVKRIETRKDIDRYSDKYKLPNSTAANSEMILYARVPEELRPQKKKKKKAKSKRNTKPTSQTFQKALQELEKKEGDASKVESGDEAAGSVADKSGDEEENEGIDDDLELDEEDMEEDNDYIQDYFDNGEDFGDADDDGLDDGPVY